ncbi:hypothetical protein C2W27_14390 [Salmonella enterica]|nr:hypothetical protein [Salmonella enterica]
MAAKDKEQTTGTETAPAREFFTVQAVGTLNKRRMRSGIVFSEDAQTVARDDFTPDQWSAIVMDPYLKVIQTTAPESDQQADSEA